VLSLGGWLSSACFVGGSDDSDELTLLSRARRLAMMSWEIPIPDASPKDFLGFELLGRSYCVGVREKLGETTRQGML